jgi:hypothetical protein
MPEQKQQVALRGSGQEGVPISGESQMPSPPSMYVRKDPLVKLRCHSDAQLKFFKDRQKLYIKQLLETEHKSLIGMKNYGQDETLSLLLLEILLNSDCSLRE